MPRKRKTPPKNYLPDSTDTPRDVWLISQRAVNRDNDHPHTDQPVRRGYDPLLRHPGVMRAVYWSRCANCGEVINEGDTQALTTINNTQRWVCRTCYLTSP